MMTREQAEEAIAEHMHGIAKIMREYTKDPRLSLSIDLDYGYISFFNRGSYDHEANTAILDYIERGRNEMG